jgi:hypothetical protein
LVGTVEADEASAICGSLPQSSESDLQVVKATLRSSGESPFLFPVALQLVLQLKISLSSSYFGRWCLIGLIGYLLYTGSRYPLWFCFAALGKASHHRFAGCRFHRHRLLDEAVEQLSSAVRAYPYDEPLVLAA